MAMPETTIQTMQQEIFQQQPGNNTLQGRIARAVYHNPKTGRSIIKVAVNDDTVTCLGNLSSIRQGDEYLFAGKWVADPQWGKQFTFTHAEVILPQSKPGIVSYIADIAYGIGRKKAGAIYDQLGDNCLEVIAQQGPGALMGVPGITVAQAEEIHAKLTQNQTLAEIASMVCGEGVGPSLAHKIYNQYGKEAVAKIRENPFVLAEEMFGVGFKTADKIARHVGVAVDSPYRIQAAYKYILKTAAEEGNCFLTPGQTIPGYEVVESGGKSRRRENVAAQVLGFTAEIGIEQIKNASLELIRREECVRETDPVNGSRIYLKGMYEAETALAGDMRRLLGQGQGGETKKGGGKDRGYIDALISDQESRTGIQYAPEQREAILTALTSNVCVITGPPGSGKSTIMDGVVRCYETMHPVHKIMQGSPTGRAAKRLAEATKRTAKTIHRLLGYNPFEGGFTINRDNQLEGPGLLVVDETSMMDCELAASLFESIPNNMKVVLVGDVDQLPSVGPGCVLRDIINSGVAPTVRLNKIYRQAEGSGIAFAAKQIRDGIVPDLNGYEDIRFFDVADAERAANIAVAAAVGAAQEHGLMGFQLLTPQKRGPAGVDALNARIQEAVNPAEIGKDELKFGNKVFRLGDKVMVVKNNYKKGCFNGDIGIVTATGAQRIDGQNLNGVLVEVDGEPVFYDREELGEITLAYASTVHKAQGGEWPLVIYVCVTQHFILLARNLAYTAITRAKKQLVVIGQEKALKIAVKNVKIEERNTWLAERLRGGGSR